MTINDFTAQNIMNASHAYSTASKYHTEGRYALAMLWESLAAYYQANAYEIDPTEVIGDQYDSYPNFYDDFVSQINTLIDNSLPHNISKNSMGGFGYHGDTPIGETWGIVYSIAPNISEIYQESNWDTFIEALDEIDSDSEYYTVETFGSWVTPTDNLIVKLIEGNGKPTLAALVTCKLLKRLEDYPYLNEDDVNEREYEQDYAEQLASIRSVIRRHNLIEDHPLGDGDLEKIVWGWLCKGDSEVIEHASRGWQGSGYIEDDTPILAAMYCMGLLDLTDYDSEELADFENTLVDYAMESIDRAFREL
jgi:hypothetical protein